MGCSFSNLSLARSGANVIEELHLKLLCFLHRIVFRKYLLKRYKRNDIIVVIYKPKNEGKNTAKYNCQIIAYKKSLEKP